MSLILDALRKSDRQRNRRAAEQLRWGPGPAHQQDRPNVSTWVMLLLVLLVFATSVGAWLALRPASETTPAGSEAEIVDNEAVAAPPGRADVRALSEELPARREAATTVTSTGPETTSETSSSPAVAEPQLIAPALSEMDEGFQQALPELMLNVHAWTEDGNARFVLINMQRYTEGDRLREGPLLRQITQDGVVLEYRNELFTLSQR